MSLIRNLQKSVFFRTAIALTWGLLLGGVFQSTQALAAISPQAPRQMPGLCSDVFPTLYVDKKTGVTVQVAPPRGVDYFLRPLKALKQRRLYKDAVEYQVEIQEWKNVNIEKVQRFYNPMNHPDLMAMPQVTEKFFPSKSLNEYVQQTIEEIRQAKDVDQILKSVGQMSHQIQAAEAEIKYIQKSRDELQNKILSTAKSLDQKEPGLKTLPEATQVALKISQMTDVFEMENLSKLFLQNAQDKFTKQRSLRQARENRLQTSGPDRVLALGDVLKKSGILVDPEFSLSEVLALAGKYPLVFKMIYREVQLQRRLQKWSSDPMVSSFFEVRKDNILRVLKEVQRSGNLKELHKLDTLRKVVRAVDNPKAFDGIGIPQSRWEKALNFYQRELVIKDALRSIHLAVQLFQSQQALPTITAVATVTPPVKPRADFPTASPVVPEYDSKRVKKDSTYRRQVEAKIKKYNLEFFDYKRDVNAWLLYKRSLDQYNYQLKVYAEQLKKRQQAQQLKAQVMLSLQTYFAMKFPDLFSEKQAEEIQIAWKKQTSQSRQKATISQQRRVQQAVQEQNHIGSNYDDWFYGNFFFSPAYMFMPGSIYGMWLFSGGDSSVHVSRSGVLEQMPLPSDLPAADVQIYQELESQRPVIDIPTQIESIFTGLDQTELYSQRPMIDIPAQIGSVFTGLDQNLSLTALDALVLNVETELLNFEKSMSSGSSLPEFSDLNSISMPEPMSLPEAESTSRFSAAPENVPMSDGFPNANGTEYRESPSAETWSSPSIDTISSPTDSGGGGWSGSSD